MAQMRSNTSTVPNLPADVSVFACNHCGHIFDTVRHGCPIAFGRCPQCGLGTVQIQQAGDARRLADRCLTG